MSDHLKNNIEETKKVISLFYKDLVEEGIMKKKCVSSIREYNDFLKEWVEGYCVDEMANKDET